MLRHGAVQYTCFRFSGSNTAGHPLHRRAVSGPFSRSRCARIAITFRQFSSHHFCRLFLCGTNIVPQHLHFLFWSGSRLPVMICCESYRHRAEHH